MYALISPLTSPHRLSLPFCLWVSVLSVSDTQWIREYLAARYQTSLHLPLPLCAQAYQSESRCQDRCHRLNRDHWHNRSVAATQLKAGLYVCVESTPLWALMVSASRCSYTTKTLVGSRVYCSWNYFTTLHTMMSNVQRQLIYESVLDHSLLLAAVSPIFQVSSSTTSLVQFGRGTLLHGETLFLSAVSIECTRSSWLSFCWHFAFIDWWL